MAQRCAQRIERRLFERVASFLQIEVDVGHSKADPTSRAWLALGEDGKLLAASHRARPLMNLPTNVLRTGFNALLSGALLQRRPSSAPASATLAVEDAFDRALRTFHAQLPVLITGETGTAKRWLRAPCIGRARNRQAPSWR
jgi:transcriptional regulator of acetoin/glycerol metabolism